MIDNEAREDAVLRVLQSGVKPTPEVAKQFMAAKMAMQAAVLAADPLGMDMPPLSDTAEQRVAEYEAALTALEEDVA